MPHEVFTPVVITWTHGFYIAYTWYLHPRSQFSAHTLLVPVSLFLSENSPEPIWQRICRNKRFQASIVWSVSAGAELSSCLTFLNAYRWLSPQIHVLFVEEIAEGFACLGHVKSNLVSWFAVPRSCLDSVMLVSCRSCRLSDVGIMTVQISCHGIWHYLHPWSISQTAAAQICKWTLQRRAVEPIHYPFSGIYNS